MSELYKGVEKLQNKHYEEAAKDLYEFILKDKLTTNIDDAIKVWKEKDKLHLSNNELMVSIYKTHPNNLYSPIFTKYIPKY